MSNLYPVYIEDLKPNEFLKEVRNVITANCHPDEAEERADWLDGAVGIGLDVLEKYATYMDDGLICAMYELFDEMSQEAKRLRRLNMITRGSTIH